MKKIIPLIKRFLAPESGYTFASKEDGKYVVYESIYGCYLKKRGLSDELKNLANSKDYEIQYENLSIPFYRKNNDGTFTYQTMIDIKNVPTIESIKFLEYLMLKKKEEEKILLNDEKLSQKFNETINKIVLFDSGDTLPVSNKYYIYCYYKKISLYSSFYYYLIIDKERALKEAVDGVLTVNLNKEYNNILIRNFIGKGGNNIKKICLDLGLKYIKVV